MGPGLCGAALHAAPRPGHDSVRIRSNESLPSPLRPRCRGQTRPCRADRRRKIRLDVFVAGAAHAGAGSARDRRPRSAARERRLPHRRLGRRADRCDEIRHRRHQGDVRRYRGGGGGDRQSRRRHQARPRGDRRRQAYRHGQCRGRRAGGAVAGGRGAQGRRGLFARLWRPAGADGGNGGLGARDGIPRRRRRQGHEIPAGLSRRDARRRLAALRADRGRGAIGRHESADVQLVPRRHQVRDRNGGDCQRLRARCARRAACCFRPAASTTCRM